MTVSFREYAKHLRESDVPVMGTLSWFHVPDSARIKHKEFLRLVETSDAPIKTPQVPKPADVFRRACNAAKNLKVPSGRDTFMNYTMRDAGYDDSFVFRRMVEEEVDGKNHELGFRVLGLATFSKAGIATTYTAEIPSDDPAYREWSKMQERVDNFLREKMLDLPAIAIRESARKALEHHLRGTRVRPSGGVYFVSMDRMKQLEALDFVINSVPECSFHILPLVDDERQREMLKEAFQAESIDDTGRLVAEMTELLNGDKAIPAKTFLSIRDRYLFQKSKLDEYSTLLSDQLSEAEAAMEICNRQLTALFDKASD